MISETSFWADILEFVRFLTRFTKRRIILYAVYFERLKDIIVAFLIVKRGKYSQSFLNTSFFLLVSAALIGGPVIAENNPIISTYFGTPADQTSQSVISTDVYSLPFQTSISEKPRDKIENYPVKPGDTLATIAKKFDISIDTIKWANDLDNDTIKPGETLKIPPVTGIVHKVAAGESIYSIAKKFHTDAQKIVNFPFNEFTDLDNFTLAQGQILYVPDGTIQAAPPPSALVRPQIVAGAAGSGNFIWPTTGGVSQYPIWYHMALDIANSSLPGVLASDAGTVVYANCIAYGYGCHIIIDHGNGYETLYGHLSQIAVSAGQAVGRGNRIGTLGSTGRSTGPHLHFEIRSGGRLLNPLSFLK